MDEPKNNSSKKISAFIVAYKEEKVIERCLRSLKDAVDEIIVIHDGPCVDKTLEIAQQYTERVYEMPVNKGIGESHYIFGINKCKYNWILRIDADEYLSDELIPMLKTLTLDNTISAYYFVWPIWDGVKYISKNWPYKIFLFQKKKIGYIDIFHHPIQVYGKTVNSPYMVEHQPMYNNYSYQSFENKTIKWCRLQAIDYLSPIDQKEKYNIDLEDVRQEISMKVKFYKYPKLCFLLSYLIVFSELRKQPNIFFQKGFWLTALINARYSYHVAREYNTLKTAKMKSQ